MSDHPPPSGGATDTPACSQLKSEELQCQDALRKCEHSQHPYLRLYQYLQQQPPQPRPSAQGASPQLKPKRGGATAVVGLSVSGAPSQSESAPQIRGLREGGGSSISKPITDGSSASSSLPSPTPSMRHSSPAPPPPSSVSHRGCAPPPPVCLHAGDKPLPPKPPQSPLSSRCLSTSVRNAAPLTPPHPSHRVTGDGIVGGGEAGSEPQQRQNSLSTKRPAPSPGGHTPTRYPAPPPPPSSSASNRPPPPVRETTTQIAVQSTMLVAGGREAPPPPPCKTHLSPSLSSDQPIRGKPSAPPNRTPSAPPPPPPRNGLTSSPRLFLDDFESRYSFHPLDDFPPPDEFKHFTRIYPSRVNRVTRGAPPLPPVGR